MLRWARSIIGKPRQERDPRDLLVAAMTDFADAGLASEALRFYDSPGEFEAFLADNRLQEPRWREEGRGPAPAELAFEIFFDLLLENDHITVIDWAAGPDQIAGAFDALYSKAGCAQLTDDERNELAAICAGGRRGTALLRLVPHLSAATQKRGREVVYFMQGEQDAHFPALLTPEAYRRWRFAEFGKGFPVVG